VASTRITPTILVTNTANANLDIVLTRVKYLLGLAEFLPLKKGCWSPSGNRNVHRKNLHRTQVEGFRYRDRGLSRSMEARMTDTMSFSAFGRGKNLALLQDFHSPQSPENAKSLGSYVKAPSPRALPRSVSRTSDESLVRRSLEVQPSSFDLNDEELSEPSVAEEAKPRLVTRDPSWQWEYSSDRVGVYDIASRRVRIARYRERRKQLSFHKVRYSARSNICQKRQRVGGRFVKTEQIIRADREALMHPNAPLRTSKKSSSSSSPDDASLVAVAELMVELSQRLASPHQS